MATQYKNGAVVFTFGSYRYMSNGKVLRRLGPGRFKVYGRVKAGLTFQEAFDRIVARITDKGLAVKSMPEVVSPPWMPLKPAPVKRIMRTFANGQRYVDSYDDGLMRAQAKQRKGD